MPCLWLFCLPWVSSCNKTPMKGEDEHYSGFPYNAPGTPENNRFIRME